MSVIVKGMEMPKNCYDYQFSSDCGDCFALDSAGADFDIPNRPSVCPLVELPKKHGRLIDADSLRENIESFGGILPEEINTFLMILEQEKTIIESEE